MDKIIVLDFGGQTAHLIARRVRESGVFAEALPASTELTAAVLTDVKGIILSGSPFSVDQSGAPRPDERLWRLEIPLLAICYGFQLLSHNAGGLVEHDAIKEFGGTIISVEQKNPLFAGVESSFTAWMSHGDSVKRLGDEFELLARSDDHIAAARHSKKQWWGLQFHPETSHCQFGVQILDNFAVKICRARRQWNIDSQAELISRRLIEKAAAYDVVALISGGVDSMTLASLLLRCLPPQKVHLLYVDTGLMRAGESREVENSLNQSGARDFRIIEAGGRFLTALAGVSEPERKRQIIGDLFISIEQEIAAGFGDGDYLLAQGTLYTDLIESGLGVGEASQTIKSHHNVNSPLVAAKRRRGLLLEPLASLYKDEVRTLGSYLGLPESVIGRHPFPGPGLAIRIIGEVTAERCAVLRRVDDIFIKELKARGLYNKIWQAFAVLLPARSVGVTGDSRSYGQIVALRAVVSEDAMSASVYQFPYNHLLEISTLITNHVAEVGRVLYDISSKPPATIEWE